MNTTNNINLASNLDLRIEVNPMSCSHFKDRNLCALSKQNSEHMANVFRIVNSLNIVTMVCYIIWSLKKENCNYTTVAYSVLHLTYKGPINLSSHTFFKVTVNINVW